MPDEGARGLPDVGTLGAAALGRLGTRVAALYLLGAGVAVLAGGLRDAASGDGARTVLLLVLVAAALALAARAVAAATPPAAGAPARWTAVTASALQAAVLTWFAVDAGWSAATTAYLATFAVSGGAIGLAISAGPRWGVAACTLPLAAVLATGALAGRAVPPAYAVGTIVSTAVAAVLFVVLRQSFRRAEQELAGADAATLAQEVSAARWRARRRADRELHDTVLATLSLLTHREFGNDRATVRELCRRDVAVLAAGAARAPSAEEVARAAPPRAAGDPAGALIPVVERWRGCGLDVGVHGESWPEAAAGLDEDTENAVLAAIAECLANIARHAGVPGGDVVVTRAGRDLTVLVVDTGKGFDPADVAPDRLGLAESVCARIAEAGGDVQIWSRPGEGTTVALHVPVPPPGPRAAGAARRPARPRPGGPPKRIDLPEPVDLPGTAERIDLPDAAGESAGPETRP